MKKYREKRGKMMIKDGQKRGKNYGKRVREKG